MAPERTCVVCREVFEPEALMRFVQGPEGRLVWDRFHRLPGRGAWLCLSPECWAQAHKRNPFPRGLKGPATPDWGQLESLRSQTALEGWDGWMGLAVKAGALKMGGDEVEQWLRQGGGAGGAVVVACDAAGRMWHRFEKASDQSGVALLLGPPAERMGLVLDRGRLAVVGVESTFLGQARRCTALGLWSRESSAE
ncbi:MAG: hypothetical protein COX57_01805 [Alphaproteobacteria bacterium CG_4_10_14_0_2_um_filter_63_37]|nr:MAG: hypothetical protein AUJ55_10960 [Proteobacteria bacterium CG1_02_64_396]PJA25742.1 MAG: hypothetical protein COX57_01805 [Alphaproteobacteria bacterium CG_4_10_14_0_2_um_filter_63_37]